ncbi:MAG TPA: hypothetical protein VLT17_03915 [Gemmatimonadales bacterium]|nr:hypothetical protein [Gemmatimonadales bacterium]
MPYPRLGLNRAWTLALLPCLALTPPPATTPETVQFPLSGYDVTYFNSNQWIETHVTVTEEGEVKGEVVFWNQQVTDLCGQVVFAIADATGRVLTYFGGASGCIRGKGAHEATIHKSFKVKGQVHPNYLVGATQLLARAIQDAKAELTPDLIRHLFPPGAHRNES